MAPDNQTTERTFLPYFAIIAATSLWGSSFAAMKVTIVALGPWPVMWVRMAVALIIILPFARRLWPLPYRSGDWKLLWPLCLFEPCLYYALEANALRFTSSSQAGLISASVPLMVAMGACFFLGERVSRWTVLGLFVALGGVVWLTLAGDPSEAAANPVLGNALELGAMMSAVGYMLLVKKLSERYNTWSLTAMQIVAGFVFFLPGARPLFDHGLVDLSTEQGLTLLYLGSCVTLGAFGLYNYGISRIPASRASAFINLIPVVAVCLGWMLLGETLNFAQVLAALCLLVGVWMSQWSDKVELKELHDV
ncbi:MAG: DMT family transporter [bacterium]|nr:DMT family transporter [bacterium]